mgnify:CR=1 FL=1
MPTHNKWFQWNNTALRPHKQNDTCLPPAQAHGFLLCGRGDFMQEIGYKKQVERWDVQEIVLRGKSDKNPFVDYNIFGCFTGGVPSYG